MPSRAPTSTPTVGQSRIKTFGRRGKPFRKHDALLIAARQRRHRVVRQADLDREPADPLSDGAAFFAGRSAAGARDLIQDGDNRVVGDGLRLHETEREPSSET